MARRILGLIVVCWALPVLAQTSNIRVDVNPRPRPPGLRPGRKAPPPGDRFQTLVERILCMAPEEQREFIRNSPEFQRLGPIQQEHIQGRAQRFSRLPPAQHENLCQRYALFGQLPPELRREARSRYAQFGRHPLPRRQAMQRELTRLLLFSSQERRQAMESESFLTRFSEEERHLLGGLIEVHTAAQNFVLPAAPE